MAAHTNDYALVIGIEKYPTWSQGRKNLHGPAADARAFQSWLLDGEHGGGLPDSNVHLVISGEQVDPEHPAPIGQDISHALRRITMDVVLSERGNPRRFYLFFSGHGHTIPSRPRDTNLCMAPFSEDRFGLSEALSLEDILNKVTNCLAPSELIVFLDCCRSIIINAAGVDTTFACPRQVDGSDRVREGILYATLRYRGAYEGGDVVRGHFSRALMDGLWGQAQEGGQITLGSLYRYLQMEVRKVSNSEHHFQDVDMLASPELLEAVLGRPRQQAQVAIEFNPHRRGEIVLESGNLEIVHRAPAEAGPWSLTLPKGLYLLRDLTTGEEQVFSVRVAEEVCHVGF